MSKRTICVVVTARASYARVKTVLTAVAEHPGLSLLLVVTASALLARYGSVVDVMINDGFIPDETIYTVIEGGNLVTSAKSTGIAIVELATVFARRGPDLVLTIADRHETIATAIAASYLNIPVAHVQGGEVTGSIDEKVRHAVTKLADVHFVANQEAAARVIRMGEDPNCVHVTGCPSIDIAAHVVNRATGDAADLEYSNYPDLISSRDIGGDFIVVMQHPVTDEYARSADQIEATLSAVADLGVPTLWFSSNVDAGSELIGAAIQRARDGRTLSNVHFLDNLPPEDFLRVLIRCRCLVGNSSVGIRESSYLGVPTVNIGSRQNGRDRGPNVVDVRYDRGEIRDAIRGHMTAGRLAGSTLYGHGDAGKRIAQLLAEVPLQIEKRLAY